MMNANTFLDNGKKRIDSAFHSRKDKDMIKFSKIRLFTVNITCGWCGKEIPVVTTRPKKCPYCGMTL